MVSKWNKGNERKTNGNRIKFFFSLRSTVKPRYNEPIWAGGLTLYLIIRYIRSSVKMPNEFAIYRISFVKTCSYRVVIGVLNWASDESTSTTNPSQWDLTVDWVACASESSASWRHASDVMNFGLLCPTWFGQEMTFVICKICYKWVSYNEILLYVIIFLLFTFCKILTVQEGIQNWELIVKIFIKLAGEQLGVRSFEMPDYWIVLYMHGWLNGTVYVLFYVICSLSFNRVHTTMLWVPFHCLSMKHCTVLWVSGLDAYLLLPHLRVNWSI